LCLSLLARIGLSFQEALIKNKKTIMFKKTILLCILIFLIALVGCREEYNLDWSVNEDRTIVSGILECDCLDADVEMLVTDENTGIDHVLTFTVVAGKRFEQQVGVESDLLSIDLAVIEVR